MSQLLPTDILFATTFYVWKRTLSLSINLQFRGALYAEKSAAEHKRKYYCAERKKPLNTAANQAYTKPEFGLINIGATFPS